MSAAAGHPAPTGCESMSGLGHGRRHGRFERMTVLGPKEDLLGWMPMTPMTLWRRLGAD